MGVLKQQKEMLSGLFYNDLLWWGGGEAKTNKVSNYVFQRNRAFPCSQEINQKLGVLKVLISLLWQIRV